MIAHCLFEQSGTFKNEFIKLGIQAFDYDIQNEYGETDFQIDLFAEIVGGYEDKPSIFDNIQTDDIIIAFFPCTRFNSQFQMWLSGNNFVQRKWNETQKLEYASEKHAELEEYYQILCKLFLLCIKRNLKLIVENPQHRSYLFAYFPIKPDLIDYDRTKNGDYYEKPTQFWFVNTKPKNNVIFEPLEEVPFLKICDGATADKTKDRQTNRSLIHPQYANRFIRQFIL